jgi:hypothetical protein
VLTISISMLYSNILLFQSFILFIFLHTQGVGTYGLPHAIRAAQTFRTHIGPGLPDAKMSGRILRSVYDLG